MAKQELHSSEVSGLAIDDRRLSASQRMRSVGCRVQTDRRHPVLNDPGLLPGRQMRRTPQPASEEVVFRARLVLLEKRADRSASVFGDLELNRATGFLLDNRTARSDLTACGDIANLQPDEVAAS